MSNKYPPTDAIEHVIDSHAIHEVYQHAMNAREQLSVLVAYAEQGEELAKVVRDYVDGNTNENWNDHGLINALEAFDDAISEMNQPTSGQGTEGK